MNAKREKDDKFFQMMEAMASLIKSISAAGHRGITPLAEAEIMRRCSDATKFIRRFTVHDSNHVAFAKAELDRLMPGDDNADDRDAILSVIEAVAAMHMSGGQASVFIPIIERLMSYAPLSPLTGNEDEWEDVTDHQSSEFKTAGYRSYQNRRCSTVFKTVYGEGRPDHYFDVGGPELIPVTFPYTPVKYVVNPVVSIST